MIDLDKILYDLQESRSSNGDARRKRKQMQEALGPESQGLSDKELESELEKKQSKARYEAVKALGNGK